MSSLTDAIKQEAQRLGFALSGVCLAASPPGYGRFQEWLASGYAGQMSYLPDRAEAYRDPQHVLAGVRSVVMLALNYHTRPAKATAAGEGRVSRYAWGEADYHDLIHDRLHALADFVRSQRPGAAVRGVVDTAPLLEREFAQLAGLGQPKRWMKKKRPKSPLQKQNRPKKKRLKRTWANPWPLLAPRIVITVARSNLLKQ
jgi:epoxyqueuosine reductase